VTSTGHEKPETEAGDSTAKPENAAPPKEGRRRLVIFTILFSIILLVALAYFFRLDFPYRYTDDAYVHGNEVFLVPRVTSTVIAINADNTDLVKKGRPKPKL
jgi:membrane fusion protein, multidrug efflux system